MVFIAGSGFGTADATNCPITGYDLDLGGSPYNPKTCATVDGSGNIKYVGVFCVENGLKVKLTTSGGGGYTSLSSAFNVEVKVNCLPHLNVPTPASSYLREVAVANSVLNEIIVAGSGFTTGDAVNCPLTTSSYRMMRSNSAYSNSCVLVDGSGNVKLQGVFCQETSLYIELSTNGGGGAVKNTGLFNVEVRADCNANIQRSAGVQTKFFEEVHPISLLANKVLFQSFTTSDPVNCPLQSLTILKNGVDYNGIVNPPPCINVNAQGVVFYLANYCDEKNLKVRVTSTNGFSLLTNLFDVKV